ncbi:MAG: hypothetical protein AAGD07_03545 [Planctomycetota bacterium]
MSATVTETENQSESQAAVPATCDQTVTLDRRRGDRREANSPGANNDAAPKAKKPRRRHIDPTTCERDYNEQEIEFMRAMDDYKRDSGRMFPTCSEVLEVVRSLGYVQLSDEQCDQLGLVLIEDFSEPAASEEQDDEGEF